MTLLSPGRIETANNRIFNYIKEFQVNRLQGLAGGCTVRIKGLLFWDLFPVFEEVVDADVGKRVLGELA